MTMMKLVVKVLLVVALSSSAESCFSIQLTPPGSSNGTANLPNTKPAWLNDPFGNPFGPRGKKDDAKEADDKAPEANLPNTKPAWLNDPIGNPFGPGSKKDDAKEADDDDKAPEDDEEEDADMVMSKRSSFLEMLRMSSGLENHPNRKLLPSDAECGKPKVVIWKIVGGDDARLGEFPWMAQLRARAWFGSSYMVCGGAVIGSRWILTAAHCLNPSQSKIDLVRLAEQDTRTTRDCQPGSNVCNNGYVDYDVQTRIPHRKFDFNGPDGRHDIGLLKTRKDIVFNRFIQPVCLPWKEPANSDFADRGRLEVIGFGLTKPFEANSLSKVLQKVSLPILPVSTCIRQYQYAVKGDSICAGGEAGKDSCQGDSGGPAMIKMNRKQVAIGVVSYGPEGCGSPNIPAVYNSVAAHMKWILDNIGK